LCSDERERERERERVSHSSWGRGVFFWRGKLFVGIAVTHWNYAMQQQQQRSLDATRTGVFLLLKDTTVVEEQPWSPPKGGRRHPGEGFTFSFAVDDGWW
jgi:hypothetical protein